MAQSKKCVLMWKNSYDIKKYVIIGQNTFIMAESTSKHIL